MPSAMQRAEQIFKEEQQFHLGLLLTEQPHPKTTRFSQAIQTDTQAWIRKFLEVDQDLLPVAARVIQSLEYAQLIVHLERALEVRKKIGISGRGASRP